MHGWFIHTSMIPFLRCGSAIKLISILILISLVHSPVLYSQSLTGRVIDRQSGKPIIGAHIFLVRNNAGGVTGRYGEFQLAGLNIRQDTLRVTHIGFAPYERIIETDELSGPLVIRLTEEPVLLGDIVVTATRIAHEVRSVAGAIDVADAVTMTGTRRHYMEDLLRYIPGVFVQSRPNQDEARITIRGSGIRTNWGVRGMRVLINGVPLTDADGLTDIDAIDLAMIDRVEVLRGPASSLYGTGSLGGVVHFIALPEPQSVAADAYAAAGGYGFHRYGISLSGTGTSHSYLVSGSYHDKDGYREQSGGTSRRMYGMLTYLPDENSELQLLAFWRSIGFDLPGSLTFEEFTADPRRANETAVINRWRKEKSRSRLGARYSRCLTPGITVLFSGFYGEHATPYHPIFMLLEEDFRSSGGEIQVQSETKDERHRIIVGLSRENVGGGARYYVNNGGVRGTLMRNERIGVTGSALFGHYDVRISGRLGMGLGLRFDRNNVRFEDLIGEASFDRETDGWSGSVGASYRAAAALSVYISTGFGFEPPAITEIRGSDFSLEAVRAVNFETGIRFEPSVMFSASVSLYDMRLTNDIIPYTEAFQTKYRNADRTRHRGIECLVTLRTNVGFLLNAAYTHSDFRFVRDESFAGNVVPGIPPHRVATRLQYDSRFGFFGGVGGEWNYRFSMNDSNTDKHPSYGVVSIFTGFGYGLISVEASVENLFNELYASYVRVNESSLRYFEPGDGRSFHVRMRVRY
jgi:iron complex outermembrane recepter protein